MRFAKVNNGYMIYYDTYENIYQHKYKKCQMCYELVLVIGSDYTVMHKIWEAFVRRAC